MSKSEDTIVALSTPSVKSALAIVRVSGLLSNTILRKISGITPKERVATYRPFKDCNGNVFDGTKDGSAASRSTASASHA